MPSSRPTSRQPSATRSDVRQHEKADSFRSGAPRHFERHSIGGEEDGLCTFTEHDSSSDESHGEDDEDKRRLTRARRANTLSKDYTENEETAIIKKFDRKLVLFLAFLYLLSFLDRSSMPNCPRRKVISNRRRHWQCQDRRA